MWPAFAIICFGKCGSQVLTKLFFFLSMSAGPTDELWIGMNDRKKEGVFDWSDHSTVRFTSWEYESPSISTDQKDCVLIRGEVRGNSL